ncbi:SprT-like domain-containing protein [Flavobacterium sp. I-STPA6A]|uniref:SprT-like domain-containing protein n=1 Tax=Flavobacterium sp. I-STPA6A TaxID=2590450 RepID=UPI00131B5688|nr:SprT-like domain-containing protein [Flavobacterium sp. I-STPA6A]
MRLLQAEKLVHALMDKHGLIKEGWKFKWLKHSSAAGVCNYTKKEINLSLELTILNTESEVRDTIIHEIAHALTPNEGHGKKWKAKCVEIGCRPEQFFTDKQKVTTGSRYIAICKACGLEHKEAEKKLSCYCQASKPLRDRLLLKWTDRKI